MRKLRVLFAIPILLLSTLLITGIRAQTTINYGDITTEGFSMYGHLWDLTKCDLTVTYTIDFSEYTPPMWATEWTSIGVGGSAWGWVGSGAPAAAETDPDVLDLDDKHNLGAPDRYDESSYDALGPETLVTPPIGNPWSNYGIWFDRDGVDLWQAGYWGSVDGGTYNTGGIYEIVIAYHAIDSTTGTMFNTVNGIQTGFYEDVWKNDEPEYYPVGKSITGDLTQLQAIASVWGEGVKVYDLTVSGCLSTVAVDIDIMPSIDPNTICLKCLGNLPVAILGSDSFDVNRIDPETIQLEGIDLTEAGMRKCRRRRRSGYYYDDANSDGYMDLIGYFSVEELVAEGALTEDTVALTLMATLYNGQPIQGTDSVNVVTCGCCCG